MSAGLVPLQFVFHLGNHQLSVVQNGLPVDYPLSASSWRKHDFRDGDENSRRHETASSDTLAVAETRRPRASVFLLQSDDPGFSAARILSPAASRWEWPTKRLIFDRRLTIVFEWELGFVVEKCIELLERAVLK